MADADAMVLATEWESLVRIDLTQAAVALRGNLVVDGRNVLDPEAVAAAGLRYVGIGRPQIRHPLTERRAA